ncbi:hypothetical protein OIV83_004145 [Microbotryomycetes sp. JL201]|nr:hypothetical protein OIV83_004145 [Microbotryomycetes sp. JL201]
MDGPASLDPALASSLGQGTSTGAHPMIRFKQGGLASPSVDVRPHVPSRLLTDDERAKLELVLDSIDPCNAMSAEAATSSGLPASIRQAIRDPSRTIAALKDVVGALSKTIRSGLGAQFPNNAVIEFERIVLALLDELETRGQPKTASKREAPEPDLTPRPTKKFMLHRGVGDVDLFSSAAELSSNDLASLFQSQDTDVINLLSSTAVFADLEGSEATLGASVSRPRKPYLPTPVEPKPVEFLYYDAFQSFAPAYDSSPATLGSIQSTAQRRSKARLEEWDDALRQDVTTGPTNAASPATAGGHSLTLSVDDEQILHQNGIDPKTLLVDVDGENDMSKKLSENGLLLTRLMKARLARIRDGNYQVGPNENRDASRLVSTFVDLLRLRPKPLTKATDQMPKAHNRALSIVPPTQVVRSTMSRIEQSMSRDSVYFGTLEHGNVVAVKASDMEQPIAR